jgi:uridine phosphorylase
LKTFSESELVLNEKGRIYHMDLAPEDIADICLLVGDQNRVDQIAEQFDSIRFKIQNREFYTITGFYHGVEFSAISTGIGSDNIDIVLNELDALVNIDLEKRIEKDEKRSLRFVRIGTCGSLQEHVPAGSHVVSKFAVGFDGVAHFYDLPYSADELAAVQSFQEIVNWPKSMNRPYFKAGDPLLCTLLSDANHLGITLTANGFYGPQGRALRLPLAEPALRESLMKFSWNEVPITNYEMETSCLYALSAALGHDAATICLVLANRQTGDFLADYRKAMRKTIKEVLDRLSTSVKTV